MTAVDLSRRTFLQGSAAVGAGLVVGFGLASEAVAAPGEVTLSDWVRIAPDNRISFYTSVQEMGQGAWCVHARILAEELDVAWDDVHVLQAPMTPVHGMFGPGYGTGGSGSVRRMFDKLRKAGAAARTMLIEAAAERWSVPASECVTENRFVIHQPSNRRAAYGELAEAAARRPVPENPVLKPRNEWRLIGSDAPRKDVPSKVDGSALYATDLDEPGMLTATILQAPAFGAKLKSVDPAPALKIKGVHRAIEMRNVVVKAPNVSFPLELPDAVAVVADGFWQAKRGLEALSPIWHEEPEPQLDTQALYGRLRKTALEKEDIFVPGRPPAEEKARKSAEIKQASEAAFADAARVLEAEYVVPLLAHAQMEPMSAAARITPDGVDIWAGTQNATPCQRFAAAMLGIEQDKIRVHTLYSGGAFGRRYKNDYTIQALYLARETGRPVKLIWTREEDMRQGWYRPAAVYSLKAGLDAGGKLAGFRLNGSSVQSAYPSSLISGDEEGLIYDLPGLCISSPRFDTPVPGGPWRSVPNTVNAFAVESFIDEIAHAAKADPLAYRKQLLAKHPRAQRLLDAVASRAGWGKRLPKGRGRGVAVWYSFNSYAAQVVEVSVKRDQLAIEKIVCAVDPGTAAHPDGIRAQGEGSIIMALTSVLQNEINLEAGRVVEGNYDTFPMLMIGQIPPMEIEIFESPEAKIGGVGEPMTPPLAPALANAIFAATGRRIRSLPLSKHGLTLA